MAHNHPSSYSQIMLPITLPMINVAVKAARTAGSLINRASLDVDSIRVSAKSANEFVTETGAAAEVAIIESLQESYPGHGIMAEGAGNTGAQDSDYIWVIKALDGTHNFIHGFPMYCVTVALMIRGKIEHSVIYDPSRNDLYVASKGRGSFVNDRRIRAGKRTRMSECLLSTGHVNHPDIDHSGHFRMTAEMTRRSAGLRQTGSAAMDLAHVASGRVDGFFHKDLNIWDVAAGSLLVTEAGGLIGNFTGESDFLEAGECMAANPRIYGQMVPHLAKFSRFESKEATPTARSEGQLNKPLR